MFANLDHCHAKCNFLSLSNPKIKIKHITIIQSKVSGSKRIHIFDISPTPLWAFLGFSG